MTIQATPDRQPERDTFVDTYISICLCIVVESTFEAVAEPARREILDLLVAGPRAVGELVDATGLSQPNTSRHLRVLREAGLVESRRAGQRRLYALRGPGFGELASWLTPYVLLWQGGLAALEHHLHKGE
jgi:DNA-binding transcriptional ArsR family regulator